MIITRCGWLIGFASLACSSHVTENRGNAEGTENGACYPNRTCNAGLTCASHVCVVLPGGQPDAALSGGSGGESGSDGATGGTGGRSGGGGGFPIVDVDSGNPFADAGKGGGASVDGGLGGPCALSTGFEGDDRCLTPPNPGSGFQLHYGPKSYDDPNEVAKYIVAPGDETVACVFEKMPTTKDITILDPQPRQHARAMRTRFRPGVARLYAYTQPNAVPDSAAPEPCAQGASFDMFSHAAADDTTVVFPGAPLAPEFAGSGFLLAGGAQVALQAHSVNTTDHPLLAEGWIDVALMPEDQVKQEVASVSFLGGIGMNILPHTHVVVPGGVAANTQITDCHIPDPNNVQLLGITADAHSHNIRTSASVARPGGTATELFYESYDWQNPFTARFDSVAQNPIPNPVSGQPGARSGDLVFQPGDAVSWECEINNDSDNLTLKFSDLMFNGEQCTLFGYQIGLGSPWSCISL